MVYSTDILTPLLNLLNNTGSVTNNVYTPGSFIDPYMQNVLRNRTAGNVLVANREIRLVDKDPYIQIVTGAVLPEPYTPKYRYRPTYTEKNSMNIQIILYTKDKLFWTDPNNVTHRNENYNRTYLEYIRKGIKKYAPADMTNQRIPIVGGISNIEQWPTDLQYWYGFLPLQLVWDSAGSALF